MISKKHIKNFKNITILAASIFLISCTSPNIPTASPPLIERSGFAEQHISTKRELLRTQEKDILKAFYQYEKTGHAPEIESEQIIKIPFGEKLPVIYCAPLRTCEIKLEIGEKISGVYPGDTSRWLFEEAVSGEGLQQQIHVIFKPKDYDIVTNAIITTTKRTYHVELHSKKDVTVKQIEFYYPDDILGKIKDIQNTSILERKTQNQQQGRKRLANNELDFSYRIVLSPFSKKPIWTPVRVFNDASHVYIQIPEQATSTALPALFIVGNNGDLKLTNYRIQKPYYIVDELFQDAVLQIGVGQEQQQVKIIHIKR